MKLVMTLLLFASVASVAARAEARTEHCQDVGDAQIAALFDRWNASLATGNPALVAANYAERSILLPTISNQPRLTPAQKIEYFTTFLRKQPQGRIDLSMIEIGCNSALDAGVYTFSFGDGSVVKARYSFTYRWDGQRWLITSHHSSVMPE